MELRYKDFRRVQPGDSGTVPNHPNQKWTYSKEIRDKKRWMFSPSTGQTITLREFQKHGRGEKTYNEYVKERIKKGEQPRKYAPRQKKVRFTGPRFEKKPEKPKRPTNAGELRTSMTERVLILKKAYARKITDNTGVTIDWDHMTMREQKKFWDAYHDLVYRDRPTDFGDIADEFDSAFDLDEGDYEDLPYGITP